MLIKFLIVLLVAAGVLGGSAYLAYEVFWKPAKLDEVERVEMEAQALLPPPPHPAHAAFAQALDLLREGHTTEAVARITTLLEEDPTNPVAADAKAILGEINLREILSPVPSDRKTPYTVVSGDSLVRIASKTGAGADLIFRANNLQTINLQIGQVLMIPTLDLRAEVDREQKTLTLSDGTKFLKTYALVGATVPGLAQGKSMEASVADKIASRGEKRIAFGEKDFAATEKLVLLSPGGASLRAMSEDADSPPPGIVLAPADLEEIFVLLSRGTPFTIQ